MIEGALSQSPVSDRTKGQPCRDFAGKSAGAWLKVYSMHLYPIMQTIPAKSALFNDKSTCLN